MPTKQQQKKALVVEDDAAISRGLRALLEVDGYAVDGAADGESGLARILRGRPDIVLLDVNLPRLSGHEVCREARGKGFFNPIIMLSSLRDSADKILGLEAGADDYVTKPFDPRELLARVRAQLRETERKDVPGTEGGRKLAALMFADMTGYSRAMQVSESSALKALHRCRSVVTREIQRGKGTIVEIVGDGFFVTFDSAVAAVQSALQIRKALGRTVEETGERIGVPLRIGIHLGEVVTFQGKPKGDAVNIAARIQSLARPGGILVSEVVRDALVGKLPVRLIARGKKKLKNIRQPVRVYSVSTE